MANWNVLKTAVANIINANGNQEITGQLLQNVLNNIITNVGENATFAGIATLNTNPGVPDGPVFYLTATAGTYPNFNGLEVQDGEAVIFLWNNNAWSKKVTGFATQEKLSQLGSEVGRVNADLYNSLNLTIGGIDSSSTLNNDTTRVRTSYFSGKFSVKANEGYKILYVFKYTSDVIGNISLISYNTVNKMEYESSDSDGIYRIVFAKEDGGSFSNDELNDVVSFFEGKKKTEFVEPSPYNNLYMWEQGSVSVDSNGLIDLPNRIRCWMWANTRIEVKKGYLIQWLFYKDNDGNFQYETISATSCITSKDGHLVVTKSDDTLLTINDDFLASLESPTKTLKTQMQGFETYYIPILNWVQGGILSDGGEPNVGETYYNNRIKTTNPLLSRGEIISFVVNSNYKIRVFRYSSEMVFESYSGEYTDGQTLTTISGGYYRFVLLRQDDGNISILESGNCEILGFQIDSTDGELRFTKPSYNTISIRNNLKDKRVSFLGDSITQGASATSQENTYHGVFCSKYGAIDRTAEIYYEKGSSSNNLLGMNGTCIAANTKNGLGSTRFVTRATAENFADSNLIVVFGGTNDLSYDLITTCGNYTSLPLTSVL